MTGIPPETWIKRIQNAMSITRSDPRWADAQADIADMRQHLRESLPAQQAEFTQTGQREMEEAKTMSPGMTFAEGAAKGASFGLGDIAARLTGSGDVLEASARANPNANLFGELAGSAASMIGPGAVVKLARMGRMARLAEEGESLKNAIMTERLNQMRAGAGEAGEAVAPAARGGLTEIQPPVEPTMAEPTPASATPAQPGLEPYRAPEVPAEATAPRLNQLRMKVGQTPRPTPGWEEGPTFARGPEFSQEGELVENLPLKNQVQKALTFGKGSAYGPETRDLVKTLIGEISSGPSQQVNPALLPLLTGLGQRLGQGAQSRIGGAQGAF